MQEAKWLIGRSRGPFRGARDKKHKITDPQWLQESKEAESVMKLLIQTAKIEMEDWK